MFDHMIYLKLLWYKKYKKKQDYFYLYFKPYLRNIAESVQLKIITNMFIIFYNFEMNIDCLPYL